MLRRVTAQRLLSFRIAHGLLDFDSMPSHIYDFPGLYTIPYRCYVAKEIDNLFISGRSLSASKLAMASTRVMATCAVGGQAVGTAAAMCAERQCAPIDLLEDIHDLQQALLKDDCYIPGFKNEDELDLARKAVVTASSKKTPAAHVIDGIARNEGEEIICHGWCSNGIAPQGEELALKLPGEHEIKEIRLTFDSNHSKCIALSLSSKRQKERGKGIPPELVRDYEVEILNKGCVVASQSVCDNFQQLNVLSFENIRGDEVKIRIFATHGCQDAKVFEVRIY